LIKRRKLAPASEKTPMTLRAGHLASFTPDGKLKLARALGAALDEWNKSIARMLTADVARVTKKLESTSQAGATTTEIAVGK